jgi:hypothetical protein
MGANEAGTAGIILGMFGHKNVVNSLKINK